MEIEITRKVKVDIHLMNVKAGVRYWEDADVNGVKDTEQGDNIPCKEGDIWAININVNTGQIMNWKQGVTASVHYKVCDCLGYDLIDVYGNPVFSVADGYVPDILCPKENGYGDYVIMEIDENGFIKDWEFDSAELECCED